MRHPVHRVTDNASQLGSVRVLPVTVTRKAVVTVRVGPAVTVALSVLSCGSSSWSGRAVSESTGYRMQSHRWWVTVSSLKLEGAPLQP